MAIWKRRNIKMKAYYTLILIMVLAAVKPAEAQQVLLQQSYDKNELLPHFGPNERHHIQLSLGAQFIAGQAGKGLSFSYGKSFSLPLLIRYKYKLSNVFALGAETGITTKRYSLHPDNGVNFPDSLFSTKAQNRNASRFEFEELPLGVFVRINFDPHRGNTTGVYLDLGAQVSLNLTGSYTVSDKLANGMERESKFTELPFLNIFREEASIRLGSTFLAITGRYNITGYFKPAYNYPVMPKLMIGLELNFTR
jgi:hypothetical protein